MRKSGINSTTPQDFLLGAGVVFKNFRYVYSKVDEHIPGALEVVDDNFLTELDTTIYLGRLLNPGVTFVTTAEGYTPEIGDYVIGKWDDAEENVLGATSGGNKLSISSEMTDITVDGATVKIKGLTIKTGETGSLETNLAQHTVESLKRAIVGVDEISPVKGYKMLVTKPLVELSDYLDNIAYVGHMTDGTEVIVIMENVICTSGLELDNKDKETAVVATKFEASSDFNSGVYDTLPVYILYPNKTANGGK